MQRSSRSRKLDKPIRIKITIKLGPSNKTLNNQPRLMYERLLTEPGCFAKPIVCLPLNLLPFISSTFHAISVYAAGFNDDLTFTRL